MAQQITLIKQDCGLDFTKQYYLNKYLFQNHSNNYCFRNASDVIVGNLIAKFAATTICETVEKMYFIPPKLLQDL